MRVIMAALLLICWGVVAQAQAPTQAGPPRLVRAGGSTQLLVQGKAFLMLGGELHNSSASGAAYLRPLWARLKRKNLNTVLAPVYWELLEPQEGKFDFALVDSLVYGARRHGLRVVVLWFGTWKNGYSMYTPGWVKRDVNRFPRVRNKKGELVAVVSAFSKAAAAADARAFGRLMQHIRQIDEKYQTVIMAQLENEMGLFYDARDYSEVATAAYRQGVPPDLLHYLAAHKGQLQPELDSAWRANGSRTAGSWEEVFGPAEVKQDWKALSLLPEELFTSYHYAHYVGQVAAAGQRAYALPLYINTWIKQPGFGVPGKYPSGGPQPHTLDIWRLQAPAVGFMAPDMYVTASVARRTIAQFHRPGNPVFVPEFKPGQTGANLALWTVGQHDALGFSPFGIDDLPAEKDPIALTYAALRRVQPLVLQHQGRGTMRGIFVDTLAQTQTVELNGYRITAKLIVPARSPFGGEIAGLTAAGKAAESGGGLLVATGPDEFAVVGKDYELTFVPLAPDAQKPRLDVEYAEEGSYATGNWQPTRRLNGDEGTGGGDYGFGFGNAKIGTLRFSPQPQDGYSVVRLKFYHY